MVYGKLSYTDTVSCAKMFFLTRVNYSGVSPSWRAGQQAGGSAGSS
jgi:hypothetical protein